MTNCSQHSGARVRRGVVASAPGDQHVLHAFVGTEVGGVRRSAATKLRAHSTKHCSGSAISHDASAASCTSAEQLTCEGAGSGRPGGFQQGRLHGTGDLHPCFDRVHRKHHAMLRDPGERASHHVSANANALQPERAKRGGAESGKDALPERQPALLPALYLVIVRHGVVARAAAFAPPPPRLTWRAAAACARRHRPASSAAAVVDAAGRARARAGGALPHGEGLAAAPPRLLAPHIPLAAQAPVLHATTHSSGACFREATLRSEVPPQNSLSPRRLGSHVGAAAMCLARSRRSCGTGQRPHCSTALTSRGVRRSVASKWTHRIYAAHAGQTCKTSDCSPFWAHLRALHRTDRRQRALCPSAEATVLMCSCRLETRHTVIGHQGPPRHSSR